MNALGQIFAKFRELAIWWVVVMPWEQVLRVRLGKNKRLLEAGAHWKIPFVDRVYRQSTRRRISCMPVQTLTTRDGKSVTVRCVLDYAIEDIDVLYETLHHAEDTLMNIAASAVAEYVSTTDAIDCRQASIESHATQGAAITQFGMADGARVRVVDFAFVRAYRLISGDGFWSSGDNLDTHSHEKVEG